MNTAAGPLHGIDEISDEAAHTAQVFYGVTIPLVVLATATYAFRMSKSTRSRSVLSDICITVGYALTITDWGLFMPQMFLTPGTKTPDAVLEGAKGAFLAIPVWGMAMAFIKASLGLTLLHVKQDYWFQGFVYTNIALAGVYGFGNMWFILFSCRPLEAAWGVFSEPGTTTCLPPSSLKAAALTGAVVSIATDIMLSLAPISFLWNLKRPRRERVVIGFLMSLGLLAGVSSLIKTLLIQKFGDPGVDGPALNFTISTWTVLEQLLGVVAACTPFCKPVFEKCLRSLGVPLTRSGGGGGGGHSSGAITTTRRRSKFESDEDPLTIEMEAGLSSSESAGSAADAVSARIYKRTEVHVVTEALRADNAADGWKKYTP
ncbi:uncharacterized protein PG998_003089 [Apiospora kogelbergensis]|uniref:uncharacterized protein n=1 Tax=Apiospora kogelbergensis TaxID=1337665 RepID=UPI00312F83AA